MRHSQSRLLLAVAAVLVSAATVSAQPRLPSFSEADTIWTLPDRLREISGLTLLSDSLLGAVQDEDGMLFLLSTETGKVVEQKRFGRDADYEAIALAGDRLFVAESDGDLHRLSPWPPDDFLRISDLDGDRIKTGLSARYDVEGMAYDAATGRLWLACKEYPGPGLSGVRALYTVDVLSGALSEAPAMLLDLGALSRARPPEGLLSRISRRFMPSSRFKPSALALLPDGHLLVLTSVEPALAVLDPNGRVKVLFELPATLPQPEGIAVHPDGRVFIASEGRPGVLAVFRPD